MPTIDSPPPITYTLLLPSLNIRTTALRPAPTPTLKTKVAQTQNSRKTATNVNKEFYHLRRLFLFISSIHFISCMLQTISISFHFVYAARIFFFFPSLLSHLNSFVKRNRNRKVGKV